VGAGRYSSPHFANHGTSEPAIANLAGIGMSDRVELPQVGRCDTCCHWVPVSPHVNPPAGWRRCAAIPDRYEDADETALALTCEDDDRSFFLTAPKFGCVLHEPTVAPPPPAG
jgi:hypothetical protein